MNPPMNSKSDTIDELFDEYYPVGAVKPNKEVDSHKAELMTKILKHRRDDFKAKLQALLLRERELGKIEVLERLMTSDPKWTYDAAKDILIDSRAELSRLSREESHE